MATLVTSRALILVLIATTLTGIPHAAAQAEQVRSYEGHMMLPVVEAQYWDNVPGADIFVLRAIDWVGPSPNMDVCFYDRHGFEILCRDHAKVESGEIPAGTAQFGVSMQGGFDVEYALVLMDRA